MYRICYDAARQALESEIVAHEPLMEAVSNMAQHMVTKKHPAVIEIESKLSSLRADLQQLKELTEARKLKLTDAIESQTVSCSQHTACSLPVHFIIFILLSFLSLFASLAVSSFLHPPRDF